MTHRLKQTIGQNKKIKKSTADETKINVKNCHSVTVKPATPSGSTAESLICQSHLQCVKCPRLRAKEPNRICQVLRFGKKDKAKIKQKQHY